ncbi:hypothetical protein E2C01_067734 [Portunus trituberculatus]|uniref:Uncharacterized protein n=1 Tax=Portunus trituberculatus TaxID=210409 RepID=A0A5B7HUK5_PORTR|nr:hypothetical protein [Portunus trituberculatus]
MFPQDSRGSSRLRPHPADVAFFIYTPHTPQRISASAGRTQRLERQPAQARPGLHLSCSLHEKKKNKKKERKQGSRKK